MIPSTISGINRLPAAEKRAVYARLVPTALIEKLNLPPDLYDSNGRDLLYLNCPPGSAIGEVAVYQEVGALDPVSYGQFTDTINGQLHIMLYIVNDPTAERFDVDRTEDGLPTEFGVLHRNLPAEIAAMHAGLAPGQIRRGLRILTSAVQTFEDFVTAMGHTRWFAEPLYYHNAVILERAGFAYMQGRRLMERINAGFLVDGDLRQRLDGSTPFRQPSAAESIRLRSWAIHDGLMGEPFTNVTMYKVIGKDAAVRTTSHVNW